MRKFMKKVYWTPGWLIVGAILMVIGVIVGYSGATWSTWTFLVGLCIGSWAAYPIVREQHERGRNAGWMAGYKTARDRTMNWEMEPIIYHAFQIWVGQEEQEGDWVASVNALPRQGEGFTAGPGKGYIFGVYDSRDAAIEVGKRFSDARKRIYPHGHDS